MGHLSMSPEFCKYYEESFYQFANKIMLNHVFNVDGLRATNELTVRGLDFDETIESRFFHQAPRMFAVRSQE